MSTIQSTTPSTSTTSSTTPTTTSTSSPNANFTTTGTASPIQASVGPVSGINYQNLITALEASQQQQVTDLQNDISNLQAEQTGYQTLEANLAPVTTSLQSLALPTTFQNFQVQLSDPTQMSVTAGNNAAAGSYQFQSLQLASTQTDLSQGFVNDNSQTVGTGTLTISAGGGLEQPTLLSALNGNTGVQAGEIRITDAAGHTTTVDLSNAYTVNDVINAINNNGVAEVSATTSGGPLAFSPPFSRSLFFAPWTSSLISFMSMMTATNPCIEFARACAPAATSDATDVLSERDHISPLKPG